MDSNFTRLLQALDGEIKLRPGDITEIERSLTAALDSGAHERVAELLTALAMRDVTINTGDGTGTGIAIGPFAKSLVIQGGDTTSLVAGLQKLRQQIAQDKEAENQVRAAEQMAAYRDALRSYCSSLPYLSLRATNLPDLNTVYVPLRARPLQDQSQPSNPAQAVSITDTVWNSQKHLFIIGQPGSGKSTLLRRLAEQASNPSVAMDLSQRYLPILIPLKRLALAEGVLETRLSRALSAELSLKQELPAGFLSEWPKLLNIRWLFLLDALDEIPFDASGKRFLEWLAPFLTEKTYRFVITTRLSGYKTSDFSASQFDFYNLLPLDVIQTIDVARKWFGSNTEQFLSQFARVQLSDLRGTPLLLTIAASIFKTKGSLPKRRTALYKQYVEIWLEEAEFRGLPEAFSNRVSEIALPVLTRLAWELSNQSCDGSFEQVSLVVESYLREKLQPISNAEAKAAGKRYIQVIARYSGVFIQRGDTYEYVHQTFREYLAALYLVEDWKQNHSASSASKLIKAHWQDQSWIELLRFALTAAADEGLDFDVDRSTRKQLIKHAQYEPGLVYRQDARRRLILIGLAGVFVLSLIVFLGSIASWEGDLLIALLAVFFLFLPVLMLANVIHLRERLEDWKVQRDSRLDEGDARQQQLSAQGILMIGDLIGLHKTPELASLLEKLAKNKRLSDGQQIAIAIALGDVGEEGKMIPGLLQLAIEKGSIENIISKATFELHPFINIPVSDDLLVRLIQDALEAVNALATLGCSDELLILVRNSGLVEQVRLAALRSLNDLGSQNLALAWAVLACDASIDINRNIEHKRESGDYCKLPKASVLDSETSAAQALAACREIGPSPTSVVALKTLAIGARDLDTRLKACMLLHHKFGQADSVLEILLELIMDVNTVRRLEESVKNAFTNFVDTGQKEALLGGLYDALEDQVKYGVRAWHTDGRPVYPTEDDIRRMIHQHKDTWASEAKFKADNISALAHKAHQLRLEALAAYEKWATPGRTEDVFISLSHDPSATISEKFAAILQDRGYNQIALQAWIRLAIVDVGFLDISIQNMKGQLEYQGLHQVDASQLEGYYPYNTLAVIGMGTQLREKWDGVRSRGMNALRTLGGLDKLVDILRTTLTSLNLDSIPAAEAPLQGEGEWRYYDPDPRRTWESFSPPLPDLWIVEPSKRKSMKNPNDQALKWAACMIGTLWQIGWEEALGGIYSDPTFPDPVRLLAKERRQP